MTLTAGLAAAGAEVTAAGPLTGRVRGRLARQGVRWASLALDDSRDPRAVSRQLALLISTRGIDLLHTHDLAALRLAARAVKHLPGSQRPRLVASLYHVPRPVTFWDRWEWKRSLRRGLSRCAAVIVPSSVDREALIRLVRPVGDRIHVIYPALAQSGRPSGAETGVLRRRLGLSGQAAVVGLSTDFTDGQAEVFLQAAAQVHQELPNLEFALIGEGPQRELVKKLAHKLELSGATIFLGRPRSLIDVISVLNVMVLLSDAGGAHLQALQALGFDIPVVAAEVGALGELLPSLPRTYLIPPGDLQSLVQALQAALHIVPRGPAEEQVETERGTTASLEQFLVSRDSWDLDRPWRQAPIRGLGDSSSRQAILQKYSPEAMIEQICEVYASLQF